MSTTGIKTKNLETSLENGEMALSANPYMTFLNYQWGPFKEFSVCVCMDACNYSLFSIFLT